ncbi:MAG: hypothetical protein AAF385_08695 [Pseudomonadota bacterium]
MSLNFALSCIAVTGPEASHFLQGQLSNDVEALSEGELQLSAWLNPSGRVISIIDVARSGDGYLLFLPEDLAEVVSRRLTLYKLRAKLDIGAIETASGTLSETNDQHYSRMLGPQLFETLRRNKEPSMASAWAYARLTAGIPWISAANSEKHTAHQLNLDRLNGFSLGKGCYVGQEIVARTEHLGKVKRRTSRWAMAGRSDENWVHSELLQDGKSVGRIISQAENATHTEFLALLATKADESRLCLPDDSQLQRLTLALENEAANAD